MLCIDGYQDIMTGIILDLMYWDIFGKLDYFWPYSLMYLIFL